MNNLRKDLGKALPSVKTALPNTLASYYEQLKQTRCGDHEFLKHSLQVWKTFTGWRATGKINAAIKCKVCGTSRCAGCQKTHTGASSKLKALGSVSVDYCCNKGLVFILWALLCGLDGVTSNEEVQQSMMEPQNPYGEIGGPYGMGMAWGLPGGPAGVSGKAKGTGYGGTDTFNEILSIKATEMALRNTPEDQKDGIIGDVLAVVTQILSDTDGPTIPLILVFLQASTVLDKVAELLRNDSIKNVTKRHSLYRRVLNFVRVLTKHKLYSAAVLKQRDSKDDGATLFSITQGKKGFNVSERSPPISSYFKNLSTQALVIIKAAKLTPREYSSENGQMQVLLCNQIVELGRSFQPNQTSKDLMQKAPTYEPLAKYHKEHCAEEIDDRVIMQNHSLYLRMRSVPQPPPIQGRMKRLVEEIANMKTSLPPGIFIRYASTRPDILKALIIGPADTPYENGLFEFDILCPTNYPLNPPLVILRTTGGGRVSFNPNLYADGKGDNSNDRSFKAKSHCSFSMSFNPRDIPRSALDTGPVNHPPGSCLHTIHDPQRQASLQ